MATSPEFDALIAEVDRTIGIHESTIVFLQGLAPLMEAAAGDRAASLSLASRVRTSVDKVAAAVTAHSPAPEPTPEV